MERLTSVLTRNLDVKSSDTLSNPDVLFGKTGGQI